MSTAANVARMPPLRRCVVDPAALRVPEEFAARMDEGSCAVVAGRCSTSDGREGRLLARRARRGAT